MCYVCMKRLLRIDHPNCPNCRRNLKGEENKRNGALKKVLQNIFPGHDSSRNGGSGGDADDDKEEQE